MVIKFLSIFLEENKSRKDSHAVNEWHFYKKGCKIAAFFIAIFEKLHIRIE